MKSMYRAAALCALSFLSAPTFAQAPSLDARVDLRIADRGLEDVVSFLRQRSGANIVVLDAATDEGNLARAKVSIELADVPWRDALELVAEKVGAIVEERKGGVLALTRPYKVGFISNDENIRDVIDAIAKAANANVVVGKEVAGTVSVRFSNVPWREALEVTAKTLGYVVVEERYGVLRVVDPRTLEEQMDTRTYQLRYLRPKSVYKPVIKSEFVEKSGGKGGAQSAGSDPAKSFSVLQALTKALSKNGELDYIETQNVLVLRDTAQVHEQVRNMLARLDVEPLQVFCDVKFVSTANSDVLNLGVDYGDNGPMVSMTGGQIPITFPFTEGSSGWEDGIISTPGGGPFADPTLNFGNTVTPDTVFGALSFTQVQATLRLLQRDTRTEVMQAPKIIALDGSEATIFVGETVRYAEAKSEQGQAGGLQLSVAEASSSPVEVGFQLLIRPSVVPGTKKIVMEVIPKETSLSGTGNSSLAPPGFDVFTVGSGGSEGSIALPRTRSSTIVTTMMLENGQTAVIGGLTTDSDVETKSKVPLLGDIPLVGELFKHEAKNRDRRSLMVFITPTIVHSSEDTEILLRQELERRRTSLKQQLDELIGTKDAAAGQQAPGGGEGGEAKPAIGAPLEHPAEGRQDG
jgi:type IV pilus assembly protein PilQ